MVTLEKAFWSFSNWMRWKVLKKLVVVCVPSLTYATSPGEVCGSGYFALYVHEFDALPYVLDHS